MPKLPPLPENNTPRLFIKYTSRGQVHECILRMAASAGQVELTALYNTMKPLLLGQMLSTDSIQGARYQLANVLFSFPLNVTGGTGTLGGTHQVGEKPDFMSFTGRTNGGRRVRFTLFTPVLDTVQSDYRVEAPGPAAQAILDALKDPANGVTAIDGLQVIWNSYYNVGVNAYYQRKVRRTG